MEKKMILEQPMEIEKKSFSIIEEHLQGVTLPDAERSILKRVIHTTADFDYIQNLVFSKTAVSTALEALQLGGTAHCFMADEEVAAIAKQKGVTRAMVSMEKACSLPKDCIFAIGNAPTALIRLSELIAEQKIQPKLIIGVPVGFVNVIEAKELILAGTTPYIVAKGNKGGSNVAAAICNALLYQLIQR